MNNRLLCDELWEMFDNMSAAGADTDSIPELLGRYVPPLAKRIGLHRIDFRIDLPQEPIRQRYLLDLCPYDDGTECGSYVEKAFTTPNGGTVKITSYADTEEDKEDFDKLARMIFTFCGRIITLDILDASTVTDILTGAQNIVGFHRYAGELAAEGDIYDYALFFTNIKNFKYVNQKIGLRNGDNILRSLVRRFRDNFSEQGEIFRLGADNFVILIHKDYVPLLIQMLKTHELRLDSGVVMHVYFKAGIFLADSDCRISEMMNYATAAYSVAKSGQSGDFVFFEKEMLENEIRTKGIMAAFPEALKNREFKVYYQPKVRSSDSELVGCEALCRWIKDGEIVPPADFIPVIERLGSIVQLDLYVLDRVCADMREWLDKGITPVRTSVNISRRDLAVPDLAEKIRGIVDGYRLSHELIEIELTETYVSDEFTLMKKLMDSLREYGFKISIDDFGSGYSTLTMLKSIKADIIKLDRAFIKDMTAESVIDKVVLKNVVNMVRELNIEVIAEGVESVEQVRFLSEAGCGTIQGYYYDKPLPRERFDERLTDRDHYRNGTNK